MKTKPFSSLSFASLSLASFSLMVWGSAHAGLTEAGSWLALQSSSALATSLQTQSERLVALKSLSLTPDTVDVTALLEGEASAEGLSRALLIASVQSGNRGVYLSMLKDLQNADGGFGHLEGWQSNPLDTAMVLLSIEESQVVSTLGEADAERWKSILQQATQYLLSQQRASGAFEVNSMDRLYVSAYVLQALTPRVASAPQLVGPVTALVNFLQAAQIVPGQWSSSAQGLFLDAMVAEALHPYQAGTPQETAFKYRVTGLQASEGSWSGDAYVTAKVVQALRELEQLPPSTSGQTDPVQDTPVINPLLSGLVLKVVDTETGLPIPGATLSATGARSWSLSGNTEGSVMDSSRQPGNYQMVLSRAGYNSITFEVTLQAGQQLNFGQIKLSRTADVSAQVAQVQGRVTDSVTGAGISGAAVTVVMVDANGHAIPGMDPVRVTSSTDGSYQVLLPQAGAFGIDIRKDGYGAVQGNGSVGAGETVLTQFQLIAVSPYSANATGTVIDNNGNPIQQALIKNEAGTVLGSTDSVGKFSIAIADSNPQKWIIEKAGYQQANISLSVTNGQIFNIGTIKLPPITQDSNGNIQTVIPTSSIDIFPREINTQYQVFNFKVIAERIDDNNNVIETQTFNPPSSDAYRVKIELPEGKWRITLNHVAYNIYTQEILIKPNQPTSLEPSLTLKPYTLSLRVIDARLNSVIEGAPIIVTDEETGQILGNYKSDWLGRFPIFEEFTHSKIKISVKPQYHSSIDISYQRTATNSSFAELGDIRVRQLVGNQNLPDLRISKIDRSNVTFSENTLAIGGVLRTNITNRGLGEITSSKILTTAFIDSNKNRELDSGELILGSKEYSNGIKQNESVNISIPLKGTINFKDQPISVKVDSKNSVIELTESNNISNSYDSFYGLSEPIVKWHFGGEGTTDPRGDWIDGSMAAPSVAPLYDTNSDGKIGPGDDPYVIYATYRQQYSVVNARTGKLAFRIPESGLYLTASIADVNKDGNPEIMSACGLYFCFYDNYGKLITKIYGSGAEAITTDIDNDGNIEVIAGPYIYHANDWSRTQSFGNGPVRDVIDLDGDGIKEIIHPNGITKFPGNKIISQGFNNGGGDFTTVANILGDEYPEIIITGIDIKVLDHNGKLIYKIPNVSVGGGPAVVADFDGDGEMEFGVSGLVSFSVFEGDGSLKWTQRIIDGSSAQTGATAFDFDGDGAFEILYADEQNFRIFDGTTGNVIYQLKNNNGTMHEYPVVVDADNDGHADILLVSQLGDLNSTSGIRMISGKDNDWAPTRNIWNEYDYHVTNINDDLSIPNNEVPHWKTHNTVRAALVTNTKNFDLTTSYLRITDNGFFSDSTLTARLGNAGGKAIPAGTPVSYYRIPPAINGVAQTPILLKVMPLSKTLEAGDYEDISLAYSGSLADFGELVVVANDAGAGIDSLTGIPLGSDGKPIADSDVIQEFSRSNNLARISIGGGWQALSLSSSLDKPSYGPNETLTIQSSLSNLGSFDTTATLRYRIVGTDGQTLATLPSSALTLGSDGQPVLVSTTWNTGNLRPGSYTVVIDAVKTSVWGNEEVVATAERTFSIASGAIASGLTQAGLSVSRSHFAPTDSIAVTTRLSNTSANETAGTRSTELQLLDASGVVLWRNTVEYDALAPNALREQPWSIPLHNAATGNYTIRSITHAGDNTQPDQMLTQTVRVMSSSYTGFGLTGTLTGGGSIEKGSKASLQWSIANQGNDDLASLPTRIVIFDPATGQTIAANAYQGAVTLAHQSTLPMQNTAWLTDGPVGQPLLAVLQVRLDKPADSEEAHWLTLSQTTLTLKAPAPRITVSIGEVDPLHPSQSGPLLVYLGCDELEESSRHCDEDEHWQREEHSPAIGRDKGRQSGWNQGKGHGDEDDHHEWRHTQTLFGAHSGSPSTASQPAGHDTADRCIEQRAAELTPYLTRLKVPYTLVSNPSRFRHLLHSGLYTQYWLLGGIRPLAPLTTLELRETAHQGDNLLMDSGLLARSNLSLFPLAGVRYRGRLNLSDGTLMPYQTQPPLLTIPTDPALLRTPLLTQTRRWGFASANGWGQNWPALLEPLTSYTQTAASFDGSRRQALWYDVKNCPQSNPMTQFPAIASAPFGRGRPVALGFDLMATLSQATQNSSASLPLASRRWDSVLSDLVQARSRQAKLSYLPQEAVRIPLSLSNASDSARSVQVILTLPAGARWLGTDAGLDTTTATVNGTTVTLTLSLAAKTTLSDQLAVRLPATAGVAAVRVAVSMVTAGTVTPVAQQELRYVVRGLDERFALLTTTLQRWSTLGRPLGQVLALRAQLTVVQRFSRAGALEQAVAEAARFADGFAALPASSDRDVIAMRVEADALLRALQLQWYLQRNGRLPAP